MGWYELPENEKEAEKSAASIYSHAVDKRPARLRKAGAAKLVDDWRAMAMSPCAHCKKPIGWGSRYYLLGDGLPERLAHIVCHIDYVEREKRAGKALGRSRRAR